MLEDNCGFAKVFVNEEFERYYILLKKHDRRLNEKCFEKCSDLLSQLQISDVTYYKIMRAAMYSKNCSTVTLKTLIVLFVVTSRLVLLNKDDKGFLFCGYLNNLLDANKIDWIRLCERYIIKDSNYKRCQIL